MAGVGQDLSERPGDGPSRERGRQRVPGGQEPSSRRGRGRSRRPDGPVYCGDCGGTLPTGSTRGCCVYRDWRFGALMPAEIMGPLAWDALEPEEQRLVAALMRFPGGEARESQLLPGLGWTSERLYAVAAPRARQSAEFCCCLYAGETFRLTDQARDCFLAVNEQEPAE